MTKSFYRKSIFKPLYTVFLTLSVSALMLSACQSTKTVTKNSSKPTNEVKKVEKKPWYETVKPYELHGDNFQATGSAVSLDTTRAVTKARHTSVAILQSKMQESLESLRTKMVDNGVGVAKQPLYILQTRTCLNDLYDQLTPDKVAVQPSGNGYKAYVQMHMSREQLWDNWKKALSEHSAYLDATNGNPIIRAWLHPSSTKDSTGTSGK